MTRPAVCCVALCGVDHLEEGGEGGGVQHGLSGLGEFGCLGVISAGGDGRGGGFV